MAQTRWGEACRAGNRVAGAHAVVRHGPVLADKKGMKPAAVQYPHSLNHAVSHLTEASGRHGVTAYALSLILAGVTFLGSVFYREISHTFGRELFGVRVGTIWEGIFLVVALAWLAALALSLMCLPHKGRTRVFGITSIGINLAAAVLAGCTLL